VKDKGDVQREETSEKNGPTTKSNHTARGEESISKEGSGRGARDKAGGIQEGGATGNAPKGSLAIEERKKGGGIRRRVLGNERRKDWGNGVRRTKKPYRTKGKGLTEIGRWMASGRKSGGK